MLQINFEYELDRNLYIVIANNAMDQAWSPDNYRFLDVVDSDGNALDVDNFGVDLEENAYFPRIYQAEVPFEAEAGEYIILVYELTDTVQTGETGPADKDITVDQEVGSYSLSYDGSTEITLLDVLNSANTGGLTSIEHRWLQALYQRKTNNRV